MNDPKKDVASTDTPDSAPPETHQKTPATILPQANYKNPYLSLKDKTASPEKDASDTSIDFL